MVPSPYASSLYYYEPGQTMEAEKQERTERVNSAENLSSLSHLNRAESGRSDMRFGMGGEEERKRAASDVRLAEHAMEREESVEYVIKRRCKAKDAK